ncbi:MAG: response regulator transcription factor [Pseudomonadota bacterium]
MSNTIRVLILDDEPEWASCVQDVTETLGWDSVCVSSVDQAREALLNGRCDIAVIDRVLGDSDDGLRLFDEIRRFELTLATLVVSQLSTPSERVIGLETGADDYLIKPFDAAELRARLIALARRAGKYTAYPTVLLAGALEIRRAARTVTWQEQSVRLSQKQFDLLWALASRRAEVVTKDTLWQEIWPEFVRLEPQVNTIEVAVARLRRELKTITGQNCIRSVRRAGYRFELA